MTNHCWWNNLAAVFLPVSWDLGDEFSKWSLQAKSCYRACHVSQLIVAWDSFMYWFGHPCLELYVGVVDTHNWQTRCLSAIVIVRDMNTRKTWHSTRLLAPSLVLLAKAGSKHVIHDSRTLISVFSQMSVEIGYLVWRLATFATLGPEFAGLKVPAAALCTSSVLGKLLELRSIMYCPPDKYCSKSLKHFS